VTYKKNNTEWDLIAAQKNVAVVGDFITVNGKPNGLGSDVIKISDDKLLFLIEETQESEIGDQLYVYEDKFKNVFLYDNNKWSYAGKISIAGTNKDYISNFQDIPIWDFKGSISVIENSNNKIPDLIVKKTGKELEFNSDNSDYKIIPARDEVYYFDDNRYIKVKKNTTVSNQNDNPIILVNTILSLSMDNGGIDKELEIQQIASQIISLPKKKSGDKKLARSLNDKGHIFLKNEDNENAIEMFEKAHIANPLDVEILNNLGYANTRIENLDAAEKYLIKTLALSPKRSTAWYNLGDAYGIKGDVNKAVACYANMYRFSSNRAKTHKFMKQTDENTDYEFGEDLESSRKKAIQSANSWFKF
jgi:tetratricopeptide (TPR) repeat protein